MYLYTYMKVEVLQGESVLSLSVDMSELCMYTYIYIHIHVFIHMFTYKGGGATRGVGLVHVS